MRAKIVPPSKLLLPYQSKRVNDQSRLKIAEKSRQIGWTWATACGLLWRKCQHRTRYDAWIASRDELQAKLFVDDCKQFAQTFHLGALDLGAHLIDDEGHSAYVLALANKRHIHSMSSTPNSHAGKC